MVIMSTQSRELLFNCRILFKYMPNTMYAHVLVCERHAFTLANRRLYTCILLVLYSSLCYILVIIFDVGDVLVLYKYRFIKMNVNLAHIYYCI